MGAKRARTNARPIACTRYNLGASGAYGTWTERRAGRLRLEHCVSRQVRRQKREAHSRNGPIACTRYNLGASLACAMGQVPSKAVVLLEHCVNRQTRTMASLRSGRDGSSGCHMHAMRHHKEPPLDVVEITFSAFEFSVTWSKVTTQWAPRPHGTTQPFRSAR